MINTVPPRRLDLAYDDAGPTDHAPPDAAPPPRGHSLSRPATPDRISV